MILNWLAIAGIAFASYLGIGLVSAFAFALRWDQKQGMFDPSAQIFGWPFMWTFLVWSFVRDVCAAVGGFYVRLSNREGRYASLRKRDRSFRSRFDIRDRLKKRDSTQIGTGS